MQRKVQVRVQEIAGLQQQLQASEEEKQKVQEQLMRNEAQLTRAEETIRREQQKIQEMVGITCCSSSLLQYFKFYRKRLSEDCSS